MGQSQSISEGGSLSATQQRFWVLEQLHPHSAVHNIAFGLRFTRQIDRAALDVALAEVIKRHEILRTQFRLVDGTPMQIVDSAPSAIGVAGVDLQHVPQPEREARLCVLGQEEIGTPFDLAYGPLLRATLFHLSDQEYVLLLVAHRIVCDGWSLRLLLAELHSFCLAGPSRTTQYERFAPDYRALALRDTPLPEDLSYWTHQLAGAPASIDLATDRQRPAVQTFGASSQKMLIEASLGDELRSLARSKGTTLFSVLLAAYVVLLHRYSRQEDLVLGTRIGGRTLPECEKAIGPLENMLALRIGVAAEMSFLDLLMRTRDVVQDAFAHEKVPFETLVRKLRLERDMGRHPLFQVTLSMQDPNTSGLNLEPGVTLFEVENPREAFDLSLDARENGDELEIRFRFNTDLFDTSTVNRMMGHFRNLLEAAAENPDVPISRMRLLGSAERHQLLVEWNDTRVPYPRDIPLHKLIEAQVEKTPDSVAVIYDSERLSYRELNFRANQLAHFLQEKGVGPDVLVAVCAERSLELVIGLLASMKAGGAYVPFDPEYPKDRLQTMLQDANSPVILTQAHLLDRLPDGAKDIFCLDRDWSMLESKSPENPTSAGGGKNLAYAIYTSGSTGRPKGVPNVHEGIVNRLLWMQDMYNLTGRDRVLQKTPFSFDVSVWEFFWPLLTGAALVVARPGGHRDPAYLVNLIAEQEITTLHFVPSLLGIFLEVDGLERCRSLRQVFASGEALSVELQQRFFRRMKAELHNLYGPTEAAVDVTYWRCRPNAHQAIVPIGRPIANTQIYILDFFLQPVPIGVPGELHIGGIGLARGYLNRPELTAEKFIHDPFSNTPGARLYKTGDLARFLPDGNIEYLGRTDFQVKLRGLRIELGEIEATLPQCDGVLQAVVTVREDHPGDKRLIAYFTAAAGTAVDIENLRERLKKQLPEYMVPSRFLQVEKFPMTTSGKVDRKVLPAPPLELGDANTMVAPRTKTEAQLAILFARVLGLPSVGVTDNFFDLGGHSLLAGRLLAQVNELSGRQIPLSAMFRGATVESLAALLDRHSELEHDPVLLEIQHGHGDRLPFFAIVPPGEESLGYAMLARHMGPEQTVYKIQGHTPVTRGKRPYTSDEMQALTSEYIAAMRTVRPHGPYCLGGLCDGTHIAEQIVRSLESQEEEVALFAIFDTWVLQHSQNRWLWKIHYYGQRLQEMKGQSLKEKLASYKRVAGNKVQTLLGDQTPRTDWQQAYWPERFTPWRFRAPVVLFKRPKQPFYYIDDSQMGWGRRTLGGVEIHEIDFHHVEILREPQVKVFGQQLAKYLARISAVPALTADTLEPALVAASSRRQNP